jgi:hypothetical protein
MIGLPSGVRVRPSPADGKVVITPAPLGMLLEVIDRCMPQPVRPSKEALDRIGQPYRVEETITGALPDDRRGERQPQSMPPGRRRGRGPRSAQIRTGRRLPPYAVALDGARPLLLRRPPGTRRRPGRHRAAALYSPIETATLNGRNPTSSPSGYGGPATMPAMASYRPAGEFGP